MWSSKTHNIIVKHCYKYKPYQIAYHFSPFSKSVLSLYSFRSGRKDDNGEASEDRRAGIYDGFSETQTESQVIYIRHWLLPLLFNFCKYFVLIVTSVLFKHLLLDTHLPLDLHWLLTNYYF